MLSYQHAYHAGNLADVHKHALLAWMLDYLTQKPKPLSYIETHAGRGLYDLSSDEAIKTGEAARGIERVSNWFPRDHPYSRALASIHAANGPMAYPGSPAIARSLLRSADRCVLAELHPGEHEALKRHIREAEIYRADGMSLAHSLLPPTPRRGLLLCDPSYEVKADYAALPGHIAKWHRAWNVGVLVLWYPVLVSRAERGMVERLVRAHPDALRHEVRFPPAREGHGMIGSGLFVLNPPYGLANEAARLTTLFSQLE